MFPLPFRAICRLPPSLSYYSPLFLFSSYFRFLLLLLPPFLLCCFSPTILHCSANAGLRILLKKDSAVFRRNSIQLNCTVPACNGPLERIYCQGPLIWATWQFGMQKECPGNRLRFAPDVVLQNFENAFEGEELRRDSFKRFCEENFESWPYLETARMPEWRSEPAMNARIKDRKMK